MLNGIINVYKEKGYTSHDVVAKLRGILEQKKIGHTGTLDPDAVGVLPVCLGKGTKLCDMLTDQSKTYEAVLFLGVETDTQDMSGKIIEEKEVKVTKKETYVSEGVFKTMVGILITIADVRKWNFKRIAKWRFGEGIEVERKPKRVEISDIQIMDINLPRIWIEVSCSKGTYIRTLCADIGEQLGCGAAMAHLKRTRVGNFRIEDAVTLSQVEAFMQQGTFQQYVTAPDSVFMEYEGAVVKNAFERALLNGNKLYPNQLDFDQPVSFKDGDMLRVYNGSFRQCMYF